MADVNKIIETAIPLTENCEVKRKAELQRRAKLKEDIEGLVRDKTKPYEPKLEYKNHEAKVVIN